MSFEVRLEFAELKDFNRVLVVNRVIFEKNFKLSCYLHIRSIHEWNLLYSMWFEFC